MTSIIGWLVTSSADPEKYSLFIKGILLGSVTYILQATTLACGIGVLCLGLNADWLKSFIDGLTLALSSVLYLVAAIQIIWGLSRKLFLGKWAAQA